MHQLPHSKVVGKRHEELCFAGMLYNVVICHQRVPYCADCTTSESRAAEAIRAIGRACNCCSGCSRQ